MREGRESKEGARTPAIASENALFAEVSSAPWLLLLLAACRSGAHLEQRSVAAHIPIGLRSHRALSKVHRYQGRSRMVATQTIRPFWLKKSARIRKPSRKGELTLFAGRRISTIGSDRSALRDGAEQLCRLRHAHDRPPTRGCRRHIDPQNTCISIGVGIIYQ